MVLPVVSFRSLNVPGGMVGSSHTELSTSPGTVGICVVTSCCSQFDDGTAYLLTKKRKGRRKEGRVCVSVFSVSVLQVLLWKITESAQRYTRASARCSVWRAAEWHTLVATKEAPHTLQFFFFFSILKKARISFIRSQ